MDITLLAFVTLVVVHTYLLVSGPGHFCNVQSILHPRSRHLLYVGLRTAVAYDTGTPWPSALEEFVAVLSTRESE